MFPRPNGRGLIEADCRTSRPVPCACFRGPTAAASLKRSSAANGLGHTGRFRGPTAAASLKPGLDGADGGRDGSFRGPTAAASLKRLSLQHLAYLVAGFPRPNGRGLIEATILQRMYDMGEVGFRGPTAAASLKHHADDGFDRERVLGFRGPTAAASLKLADAGRFAVLRFVSAAQRPRPH